MALAALIKRVAGRVSRKSRKITLKVGCSTNEESVAAICLKKFKELVEQESNGRIEVSVFPNAQLGDDVKMISQMRAGTLEGAVMSSTLLASVDKKWMIFDAPFLFPSSEVLFKVVDGPIGQKLMDSLPQNGLLCLAYPDYGYRQLTNSVKPVKSLADAKGLKIRVQENPVHIAAFEALGMSPTPMPFSELFTALQQKAIDGQENPLTTIYLQKFYEVNKYLTLTNHVNVPFVFLFSKNVWDKIPAADQQLIKKAGQDAAMYERQVSQDMAKEAVANLEKAGMTVTTLTPEQAAEFKNATKDVIYKFQDQIGKDFIDEMNAEVAKYSKQ